jgi:hypothetical protein
LGDNSVMRVSESTRESEEGDVFVVVKREGATP